EDADGDRPVEPGGDVRRGVGAHAQEPGRGQAGQPGVAGQDHQPDGGDGGEQDEIDVAEPVLVERERQDDGKGAQQGQPGVLGPGVPEGEVPAVGGVVDAGGGGHASDPLDPDLAEEAVGLHQEDRHQDDEREDLRGVDAPVALRVLDEEPDDSAPDHGAHDRVETAEDDHREDRDGEALQFQAGVAVDAGQQQPPDAAGRAGQRPGEGEDPVDADALDHGR